VGEKEENGSRRIPSSSSILYKPVGWEGIAGVAAAIEPER
jgi:hypothetical protein